MGGLLIPAAQDSMELLQRESVWYKFPTFYTALIFSPQLTELKTELSYTIQQPPHRLPLLFSSHSSTHPRASPPSSPHYQPLPPSSYPLHPPPTTSPEGRQREAAAKGVRQLETAQRARAVFSQAIRPLTSAASFRCSVSGLHAFPPSLAT